MKLFMLKSFIIISLMSISVLAGTQMASNGIHNMKGYGDSTVQNSVASKSNDTGASTALIGSHDLQAKKQKLEQMNAFNFFSAMGRKMSDGITNASQNAIQKIMK